MLLNHLLTGMSVLSVSEETKNKIRAEINIDEQRIKETVKIFQEWLEKQPHLPHDYGKYCNDSLTLFGFISVYLKPLSGIAGMYRLLEMPETSNGKNPLKLGVHFREKTRM